MNKRSILLILLINDIMIVQVFDFRLVHGGSIWWKIHLIEYLLIIVPIQRSLLVSLGSEIFLWHHLFTIFLLRFPQLFNHLLNNISRFIKMSCFLLSFLQCNIIGWAIPSISQFSLTTCLWFRKFLILICNSLILDIKHLSHLTITFIHILFSGRNRSRFIWFQIWYIA